MKRLAGYIRFDQMTSRQATILLVAGSLVSNVLGLVRDLVYYRTQDLENLDIFFASFRVADLLYTFVVFGALSSAAIPVLSGYFKEQNRKAAYILTDQLLTWTIATFSLLAGALAFFMPSITEALVPGFSPERAALTTYLSRILLLQSTFLAISFVMTSYLQARKHYTSSALAPLAYNLALITTALMAPRSGIHLIAYGAVIGAALHCLIQVFEALRTGYRPSIRFSLSPELRDIAKRMIPRSIAQTADYLALVTYTSLGSLVGAGAIAIYTGMNNLRTTPLMVLVNPLATAIFPKLSEHGEKDEAAERHVIMTRALDTMLFVIIPITILGFILRAQIVRLYIATREGVTWDETLTAISVLAVLLCTLIPVGYSTLLNRLFFAKKNTLTPMWATVSGAAASIVLANVFIRSFQMGIAGAAYAELIGCCVQALVLSIAARKEDGYIATFMSLAQRVSRYAVGALLSGWVTWATLQGVVALYERFAVGSTGTIAGLFVQGAVAATLGIATYIGYAAVTSKEEIRWILKRRSLTTV